MWGKVKKHKLAKIDTWVGQQTRLQGDVHFSGGLHVDGVIKGNVTADGDSGSVLEVSEHGSIEGRVEVPTVILNGEVVGDVHARERIELAAHGRVTGNVYYNLIEMVMGAEVNGSLVHQASAAALEAPRTDADDEPAPMKIVDNS